MENKRAHLEMLQAIVSRMASNSFHLKGWSVLLVSALFALAASDSARRNLVWIAYLPGVAFWVLDGYFLRQERLFRKLYDRVRGTTEGNIDFSMNTSVVSGQVEGWLRTTFSVTLRIFHGAVIVAITAALLIVDC